MSTEAKEAPAKAETLAPREGPTGNIPRKMEDFKTWSKDMLKKHAVVLQNEVDVFNAIEKNKHDESMNTEVVIRVEPGNKEDMVHVWQCKKSEYGFGHTDNGFQLSIKGDIYVFPSSYVLAIEEVKADGAEK